MLIKLNIIIIILNCMFDYKIVLFCKDLSIDRKAGGERICNQFGIKRHKCHQERN